MHGVSHTAPYNRRMSDLHIEDKSSTSRSQSTKTRATASATTSSSPTSTATKRTTTRKRTAHTERSSSTKARTRKTAVVDLAHSAAPAPTLPVEEPGQFGRVAILDITPNEERGLYPARVELGEQFHVSAEVFIEGRAKAQATAVLRTPRGKIEARIPMVCTNAGLDRFEADLVAGTASNTLPWNDDFAAVRRHLGLWSITIEGWEDVFATWLHDATIKIGVRDIDSNNALLEGADILDRWAASSNKDSGLNAAERKELKAAAAQLRNAELSLDERLQAVRTATIEQLHTTKPLREALSESSPQTLLVQRPKSSFAAWYQFFPRSEGATYREDGSIEQGTFATAISGLERAKQEGFDIVYLPPIFPIGVTNRKGRNNTLVAGPADPGSPFGIGSELGGHDTVDPLLGTMDDFKAFCAKAHELGLEIALDFALQCSPDHPWVTEHPTWFRHKADGTIAFAENPPKKYQDIYPIDFNADMPGIIKETVRLMNLWIDAGVTIFRVDNPHTKPVRFWQEVIAQVTHKHPETLFLAEAFTRPGMMRALSYAGFTQSHCYFPWRNTKEEISQYLLETNGDNGYYQHNTFWPTTPDILTDYVRDNGIAGHAVRAVLAAMGSPSWGIYNGFELIENRQRPGVEEQIDNEKYEIKVRDWSKAEEYGIAGLLTALNRIRRAHMATRSYHNVQLVPTSDPNIVAFMRHTPAYLNEDGKPDTLIIVVNLDGHNAHQSELDLDLAAIGLGDRQSIRVHDELTDRTFEWGSHNFVSLAPWADVAHILSVQY